jgi:phosphate transport system protein
MVELDEMNEHTVQSYDADLLELRSSIMRMGVVTQQMLSNATAALKKRDGELGKRVVSTDELVDSLHRSTEEKTILTIARRQPVASDLRALVSSIRIAADIERVGDLSKNIARRTSFISMGLQLPPSLMVGFDHMSRSVITQYSSALDAYSENNSEKALSVWRGDAEIDGLYTLVFRDAMTHMLEEPRNLTFFTHFLFCLKNLERIGDHATNIAEAVYYIETGSALEGKRPQMDVTEIEA